MIHQNIQPAPAAAAGFSLLAALSSPIGLLIAAVVGVLLAGLVFMLKRSFVTNLDKQNLSAAPQVENTALVPTPAPQEKVRRKKRVKVKVKVRVKRKRNKEEGDFSAQATLAAKPNWLRRAFVGAGVLATTAAAAFLYQNQYWVDCLSATDLPSSYPTCVRMFGCLAQNGIEYDRSYATNVLASPQVMQDEYHRCHFGI